MQIYSNLKKLGEGLYLGFIECSTFHFIPTAIRIDQEQKITERANFATYTGFATSATFMMSAFFAEAGGAVYATNHHHYEIFGLPLLTNTISAIYEKRRARHIKS